MSPLPKPLRGLFASRGVRRAPKAPASIEKDVWRCVSPKNTRVGKGRPGREDEESKTIGYTTAVGLSSLDYSESGVRCQGRPESLRDCPIPAGLARHRCGGSQGASRL